MPNTRHSKCLEYHIKIANYLIQIVQQDKLNRPQVGKKKKKNPKWHIFSGVILRYSRRTENGSPSSHIHGGVRSLNSWWGPL